MENIATVIILLTVVTVLAEITDKIKIPYPILLVLAGIGIGLFPGLPHITLTSRGCLSGFSTPSIVRRSMDHFLD